MDKKWVNRIVFWVLAIAPLALLVWLSGFLNSTIFLILFLAYILVYRPLLHILRLRQLNEIQAADAWKFFIPFYSTRYTGLLWLG